MELRSAFKIHIVSFWAHLSPEISVILFLISTIGIVSAKPPPGHFCNAKTSQGNNQTIFLKDKKGPGYCNSTEPINWITNEMYQFPVLDANDTALPFRIETELVTCDEGKRALFNSVREENSTIPYYFKSRLIINTTKYASSSFPTINVKMFCGNFTPPTNSTPFPRFLLLKTEGAGEELEIRVPKDQSISPEAKPLSNIAECNESALTQYQDESSGNCSCLSPKLFHCDNLMECRFLAHWISTSKSKKACMVRKVENLCNSTSFSLPESIRRKGGLLFCESGKKDSAPYILFYPSLQQPNSTNRTNGKAENNLTEIQILGNDTGDYEHFLILSILSPKDEKDLTTSSKVVIECKGPAFLFLQGFFWNVAVNSKESESKLLPNFNISDSKAKDASDGEKYVSSILRISPDGRNESLVLHVACEAALSDRNVFITSTRTVKLEVDKPQVKGEITCLKNKLLFYECNATRLGIRWTWFHENSTPYEKDSGDSEKRISLSNCPNETITCTATLPNGVENSYQFLKEHCKSYAENVCRGVLPTTTPIPTTTTTTRRTTTTTTMPSPTNTTSRPTTNPSPTSTKPSPTATSSSPITTTTTTASATIQKTSTDSYRDHNHGPTHSHHTVTIVISSIFGVCLLIFVPCLIVLMRKNKKQSEKLKMSDEDINAFLKGDDSAIHFLPYDTQLEIPKGQITIGTKVLGSGAFGKVFEGQYGDKRVAIKTVNKSAEVQYFKALLSEIKIVAFLGKHENLVELVGACTWDIKQRNVYAVFELCENGNLIQFLRKNRDNFEHQFQNSTPKQNQLLTVGASRKTIGQRLSMMATTSFMISTLNSPTTRTGKMTGHDLVRWSMEIASGMDVVAQKKIYHGDLAARNILLDSNLVAKVGDFGLSRQLFEYSVYVQNMKCPLPLKWMSIESLRDLEFSIQSDVWSYGITLWEIFSLGCQPYPNMDWNFESWQSLLDGERMKKPEYASDSIYEIMLKCWNAKPDDRPTFAQLKTMFDEERKKIPF